MHAPLALLLRQAVIIWIGSHPFWILRSKIVSCQFRLSAVLLLMLFVFYIYTTLEYMCIIACSAPVGVWQVNNSLAFAQDRFQSCTPNSNENCWMGVGPTIHHRVNSITLSCAWSDTRQLCSLHHTRVKDVLLPLVLLREKQSKETNRAGIWTQIFLTSLLIFFLILCCF